MHQMGYVKNTVMQLLNASGALKFSHNREIIFWFLGHLEGTGSRSRSEV